MPSLPTPSRYSPVDYISFVYQVLVDVTGEEFERFMDLASKLQYISTPEGGQEMAKLVSNQAELGTEFQVCVQGFMRGHSLPVGGWGVGKVGYGDVTYWCGYIIIHIYSVLFCNFIMVILLKMGDLRLATCKMRIPAPSPSVQVHCFLMYCTSI